MFALYKKELSAYFSSLIAYLVIIVYLIVNGLFLWVFPGDSNVFSSGYANIDTLFILSPWIFLFLVPAITMRFFAEESKSGTIELLLTQPIRDFQIVFAKYLAGLSLVLFALLPSLLYFLCVFLLASPTGNVDVGGIWGSYIGLFFLAAAYVAIGVFASSVTSNQIVAFLISVALCFFAFLGFDYVSGLGFMGIIDDFLLRLSINSHYKSLSRGVVDSRDVVYFLAFVAVFLLLSKIKLESRKW